MEPSVQGADEFKVMTSGVFTAAHLALVPMLEAITRKKVVTVTTSIGTGDSSIPSRLGRREPVDLLIVAEPNLRNFVEAGFVLAETRTQIARSAVAVAVREGDAPPDVSDAAALIRTFLRARRIAYSASESGKYLTTQLYRRLGIADACLGKSHFVGNGERTGAVVARGDADLAFQQVSELLPVKGIAHITPLPADFQSEVLVATGVCAWSRDPDGARAVVRFLASPRSAQAIAASGLVPESTRPGAALAESGSEPLPDASAVPSSSLHA